MGELTAGVISRPSKISTRERGASELVRGLGLWSATAAVVGVVIGSAIFLVGSEVARNTGSVVLSIAAWLVGGLFSLCGSLCLAELGAAMPRAGGMYAYLNRGVGPAWGFLYGWTSSTVVETASCAGVAAGFIRLVGFLVPAAATPLFFIHIPVPFHVKTYEFAFNAAQPLAAGAIVLITAINFISVRSGGRIQLLVSSLKVGAMRGTDRSGARFAKRQFRELRARFDGHRRRYCRCVPRCSCPSDVGLQRMAHAWASGGRGGKPRQKHSAGACLWNVSHHHAPRFGEFRLPSCFGGRQRRAVPSCRFRRPRNTCRQGRRKMADHRNDDFRSGLSAREHFNGSAYTVRHGA